MSFLFVFITPKTALASEVAGNSGMLKAEQPQSQADLRLKKLEGFLKQVNSPLTPYAQTFVQTADKFQIDWRLLPAISGMESTFGRFMIAGTYNAYGWGGGTIRFTSWEDSINTISKALSEKYYAKGLTTPEKINPVYCPPNKTWAGKVRLFMDKIENYEDNFDPSQLALSL